MNSPNHNPNEDITKEQREIALKKMSKYLLAGAEMLRESCSDCFVPLLRNKKEGTIFCGSCGKKISKISPNLENKPVQSSKSSAEIQSILDKIESILIKRLEHIGNHLDIEKQNIDITELKLYLETIDSLIDLLQKISENRKLLV